MLCAHVQPQKGFTNLVGVAAAGVAGVAGIVGVAGVAGIVGVGVGVHLPLAVADSHAHLGWRSLRLRLLAQTALPALSLAARP